MHIHRPAGRPDTHDGSDHRADGLGDALGGGDPVGESEVGGSLVPGAGGEQLAPVGCVGQLCACRLGDDAQQKSIVDQEHEVRSR